MDESKVRAWVEQNIEKLAKSLGIPHWRLTVSYGHLESACPNFNTMARCTRRIDYNQAHIEIDPAEIKDEEDAAFALRHELFHILLSPFDLVMQMAQAGMNEDSPEYIKLDRVWDHAVEQAVINLQRMWIGVNDGQAQGERQGEVGC